MQHKINLRTALTAMVLVTVAGLPATAWALGLGELQSDTRIGQPFSARIPITGATADVLQGLHVDLASAEAYKSANLNEPDYLFSLKFTVEQGPQGPYVRISSQDPVKLPFLNLLINAHWASGEVTRQYTVLLNPPVFVAGSKARQSVSAPSTPETTPAQQPAESSPARQPAQKAPAQQPAPQQQAPQQQASSPEQQTPMITTPGTYKVEHGDTLWGLSKRKRPGSNVSVNQMMIALYRANPHAFNGNINRLRAGAVLQMPTSRQIAQITAEEATRIVARQNDEWQAAESSTATAGNTSGTTGENAAQQSASPASTGNNGEQNQTQAQESMPASTTGRVVLTTPEVTAANTVAATPGSAAESATTATAAMAGAQMSAGSAGKSQASVAAAGSGASAGGPLKVQSNAMAGLATSGTAAGAAKQAEKKPATHKNPPANNANSVNSVNSVNTEGEQGSGLMYWIRQPAGWVVIGALVLILLALFLLLSRRRKNAALKYGPEKETVDAVDQATGPEASAPVEEGIPHEAEGGIENTGAETEAGEDDEDLGIATYIGGPSLDVNKVDALDEADLHLGFGDYGKAAEILREAINHNPERLDLHRKLLDALYAAGDGEAFVAEAATYRQQADASQWEEVAVMGRQLRPHEEMFATAAPAAAAEPAGETEDTDFMDIDLDRLTADTEGKSDQNEFERTMDELSTFIETYVPASSETPVSLQLPPEDQSVQEDADGEAGKTLADDEPLEFSLDDDDLPAPRSGDGFDEEEAGDEENLVDTKLDLARAYIDMGDGDSARGVLEEVIDEGDENQSGEARRLLGSLD